MTASTDDYELLDFGDGRKLERFGDYIIDRPSPAAENVHKSLPKSWREASARYDRTSGDEGKWTTKDKLSDEWRVSFTIESLSNGLPKLQLSLEPLPSGQIGVFPEQHDNWHWIARQVARDIARRDKPLRVLNLFAYTGGSTLAAAAAGAEVVHIDAARSVVERARINAELSGLADRPIRWITEDSLKFCQREVKRRNQYDAVILDPPTYGHGPKGEPWKISEHLLPLLELCSQLTKENRSLVLLTCHSPGIGPAELSAYLAEGIFGHCGQPPESGELYLETRDGRRLHSGTYARWPA
jgi:23S rRNA (cytosine1962-C5)-methyltransferase